MHHNISLSSRPHAHLRGRETTVKALKTCNVSDAEFRTTTKCSKIEVPHNKLTIRLSCNGAPQIARKYLLALAPKCKTRYGT